MIKKGARIILEFTAASLLSLSAAYFFKDNINYYINTARYCNSASEDGFPSKENAFALKLVHERNKKNNLETYLQLGDLKHEILQKEDGLVLNDPYYNWNSFSDEEKKNVLVAEIKNDDDAKLEKFLDDESLLFLLKKIPQESRAKLFGQYINTAEGEELNSVMSKLDYGKIWASMPYDLRSEIIINGIKDYSRRTLNELKSILSRVVDIEKYAHDMPFNGGGGNYGN